MMALARQSTLLVLAAGLTWWIFLRSPIEERAVIQPPPDHPLAVALAPESQPGNAPAPLPASPVGPEQTEPTPPEDLTAADEPDLELAPVPPPAELGTPEGSPEARASVPEVPEEVPAVAEEVPEVANAFPAVAEDAPTGGSEGPIELDAAPSGGRPQAEDLMADPSLLAAARSELSRESSQGFATVLLATPEDQLAIARFFGEELVLVPRTAIDPETESPRYFRVTAEEPARPEMVMGQPPLAGYRQYRDLFDYEYARLPAVLRDLRRSVLARSEIYVFAALIPAREWSLIIGRRREALALSGRDPSEVRRFVLRYVQRTGGGFDVDVEEIVFTTGARFQPSPSTPPAKEPRSS